jgi:hypothetical protein
MSYTNSRSLSSVLPAYAGVILVLCYKQTWSSKKGFRVGGGDSNVTFRRHRSQFRS